MRYLEEESNNAEIDLRNWKGDRTGTGPYRIAHLATRDQVGDLRSNFEYGQPITFDITLDGEPDAPFILGVRVLDALGVRILHLINSDDRAALMFNGRTARVQVTLPNVILNDGIYYISVAIGDSMGSQLAHVGNCLQFKVVSHQAGIISSRGCVRLPAKWSVE